MIAIKTCGKISPHNHLSCERRNPYKFFQPNGKYIFGPVEGIKADLETINKSGSAEFIYSIKAEPGNDTMRTEAFSLPVLSDTMQAEPRAFDHPVDPESWVDAHGDCLFRYAFARLRDESLAEDIVQETFLSAIRSLDSYGGRATERTWLTGILKHKIIDHFRRNKNLVQITDDETDLSALDHFFEHPSEPDSHWAKNLRPVSLGQSPDQAVESEEFWEVMNTCLAALPERIATVFALREMDGLTSDEVCEVLSLSPSNFWVIMHRARMQLRRCIEIKWFRKVI